MSHSCKESPCDPPDQEVSPIQLMAPRPAYNLAASSYDDWDWQTFWRLNEAPIVVEMLGSLPTVRTVLDVGVGTGYFMHRLHDLGYNVIGIDISENMLAKTGRRLGNYANLIQGDAQHLPFAASCFDLVLCNRILTHVSKIDTTLRDFGRVLNSRGWLLVSDVDAEHQYANTSLPIGSGRIAVETHKRSLDDLQSSARSAGFGLERTDRLKAESLAWLPEGGNLSSIDRSGARPISYIALFRQCF